MVKKRLHSKIISLVDDTRSKVIKLALEPHSAMSGHLIVFIFALAITYISSLSSSLSQSHDEGLSVTLLDKHVRLEVDKLTSSIFFTRPSALGRKPGSNLQQEVLRSHQSSVIQAGWSGCPKRM